MTMIELEVIAGIDTHADTHHVAVIETAGRRLGDAGFPTTLKGYKAIAAFGLADGRRSTHSYGVGITQHLKDSGVCVVEVIRPNRQVRRMRGKTDQVDAYAAASAALATDDHPEPKQLDGLVEPATSTQRVAVRPKHELPLAFRSKVC